MTATAILLGAIMVVSTIFAVCKLCEITGQIFTPRKSPDGLPVRFYKEG